MFAIVFLLGAAVNAVPAESPPPEPYWARVIREDAAVRSGPGEQYYATDRLRVEEFVQVFRHDGDWAAVRPPHASFSWVRISALRLHDDGVAEVVEDGAPAKIGSRVSADRSVCRVHLDLGELVKLLEHPPEAGDGWLKIAPPAGEFRWIHLDHLEGAAAPLERPLSQTRRKDVLAGKRPPSFTRLRHDGEAVAIPSTALAGADTTRPVARLEDVGVGGVDKFTADENRAQPRPRSPVVSRAGFDSAPTVDELLDEASLMLSFLLLKEPRTDELSEVQAHLRMAGDHAVSLEQRERTRELQTQLDRLLELQDRAQDLAHDIRAIEFPRKPPAFAAVPAAATPPPSRSLQGYLVPRPAHLAVSEEYVLENGLGEVVTAISPPVDLDVRPFLYRRVRVVGRRGYAVRDRLPRMSVVSIELLPRGAKVD